MHVLTITENLVLSLCCFLETQLKGHSQLCDRADLGTSFVNLKSVHLNLKSKIRVENI